MNIVAVVMAPQIPIQKRMNLYLNTSRHPNYRPWEHAPWQKREIFETCTLNLSTQDLMDLMHLRNRGGSKTRDMAEAAIFLGYQRNKKGDFNRIIWFAGGETQFAQARQYFQESRYVDRRNSTAQEIRLWNGNTILFRLMSEKQAVSGRADYIFFDEEQSMKEKIYQDAIGSLVGGSGIKIHMGTTELDTVLDFNYQRLEPLGLVHEHHIDECVWTTVEKELKNYDGMPQFVIDSQLYCQWVRAGGKVFTNLEVRELTWEELNGLYPYEYMGVDPNPKSGHACVKVQVWKPQDQQKQRTGVIYVSHEWDSRQLERYIHDNPIYLQQMIDEINTTFGADFHADGELDDSMIFSLSLWKQLHDNTSVEIEENNGQEFYKTFTRVCQRQYRGKVHIEYWDEKGKANRIFAIRKYKIVVNPSCKQTAHHLGLAAWDPKDPQARLQKSPEQHYLDAFIHACQFAIGFGVTSTAT